MSGDDWINFLIVAAIVVLVILGFILMIPFAFAETYSINKTIDVGVYVTNTTIHINDTSRYYVDDDNRQENYQTHFHLICEGTTINVTNLDNNWLIQKIPDNQSIRNIIREEQQEVIAEVSNHVDNILPSRNESETLKIDLATCKKDIELKQKDVEAEANSKVQCDNEKTTLTQSVADAKDQANQYWYALMVVAGFSFLEFLWIVTDGFRNVPFMGGEGI
jgi:hypothetical protein